MITLLLRPELLYIFLLIFRIVAMPLTPHAGIQSSIKVTRNEHSFVFAQQVNFVLGATSDVHINRAVLTVRSDAGSMFEIEASITPSTTIEVVLTQDLRSLTIPPFSVVTYHWELGDENNSNLTTPDKSFEYNDNRFGTWQELTRDGIRVLWIDGGEDENEFGQAALNVALDALPRIASEIGVDLPSEVDIYIYPGGDDLCGALRLGGRDCAAGQARPELGVVLVDVPSAQDASIRMRRVIPHELTHLVIYEATQPSYDNVPAWLDEGLASLAEASPDARLRVELDKAIEENRLISFEVLCAPFSSDNDEALLSYAQSGSLLQFIRDNFGFEGIRNLLMAYRENAQCAPGVERALGMSLTTLENKWRAQFSVSDVEARNAIVETSLPWLLLIGVGCLTLMPILGGLPLFARRKK